MKHTYKCELLHWKLAEIMLNTKGKTKMKINYKYFKKHKYDKSTS